MENVKKINDELTVAGQVTPEQLQQAAQEGFKSVLLVDGKGQLEKR